MKNKIRYIVEVLVLLIIIFYSTIYAVRGFDVIDFLTNNAVTYPLLYFIPLALVFTFPLFNNRKNMYELFAGLIITISLIINFILLASFSHMGINNVVFSMLPNADRVITALFINSIIALLMSFLLLIVIIHQRKLFLTIHTIFLMIYLFIHFLWLLGIKFTSINSPNLFTSRPYDLYYQLLVLLKGGYVLVSSFVFMFIHLNEKLNKFPLLIALKLSKTSKIVIWFFFGLFGIERMFDKNEKWLLNIQMLTASFIISYIVAMNTFYYDLKFNLVLFMGFILAIIAKVVLYVYSLIRLINN